MNYPLFLNDRWRACFESPIECAVVLVCLLAWGILPSLLSNSKRGVFISLILVSLIFFCIGLTGSRGPLLGAFASMAGFVCLFGLYCKNKIKNLIFLMCAGCLILSMAFFYSSTWGRIGSDITRDNSVLNRIEIWMASGQIIGSNPLGIGCGESGYFYSQWMQPLDRGYSYTGLLNSYLEIATELGFITLLVLVLSGSILIFALIMCRENFEKGLRFFMVLGICAGTSFFGLVVCALSSSVHNYTVPKITALLDATVLIGWVYSFRRVIAWKKTFVCAGLFTLAVAIGIVVLSRVYANAYEVEAVLRHGGMVHLAKKEEAEPRKHLFVMLDRAVMGKLYGQKLRYILLKNKQYSDFWVLDPRRPLPEHLPAQDYDLLVFGEAVSWLPKLAIQGVNRWYVVNPRGDFCKAPHGVSTVVWLSAFDSTGNDAPWRIKHDRVRYRVGSSLGGAITYGDIENADGFLIP